MTHQDETLLPPLPPGHHYRGWAARLRQRRLQASPWQDFSATVARRYGRPVAWVKAGEAMPGVCPEKTMAGPAAEAPEFAGDLAALERTSPQSLDRRSREILAAILERPIPQIKIYANTLADTIVRQYRADALSFRNLILLRSHLFAPHRREGLALLGHELNHVNQSAIPAPTDETQALANERKILSALEPGGEATPQPHLPGSPPPGRPWGPDRVSAFASGTAAPSGPAPSGPSMETGAVATLRAARPDRPLGTATSGTSAAVPAAELSERQLRLIKDEVYRDIMHRIRTEFERGG